MTKIEYTINEQTRIGGRRENQDSSYYQKTEHGLLAVVCDGMGGVKGGKTASTIAISTIFESVKESKKESPKEVLSEAIERANLAVYQAGMENSQLRGMGTTVVALLINEEKATTAHVGDSRIYQVRKGKKIFRTFDHSMVFELVKQGQMTEEQARLSAKSNIILKALGTSDSVEVEINDNIPYLKSDRFMLCSDGISGSVDEKRLCKLAKHNPSVAKTLDNMTETIDRLGIEKGGGHDNLTAILIKMKSNSKMKAKMSKRSKIVITILITLLLAAIAIGAFAYFKGEWNPFQSATDITVADVTDVTTKTEDKKQ